LEHDQLWFTDDGKYLKFKLDKILCQILWHSHWHIFFYLYRL